MQSTLRIILWNFLSVFFIISCSTDADITNDTSDGFGNLDTEAEVDIVLLRQYSTLFNTESFIFDGALSENIRFTYLDGKLDSMITFTGSEPNNLKFIVEDDKIVRFFNDFESNEGIYPFHASIDYQDNEISRILISTDAEGSNPYSDYSVERSTDTVFFNDQISNIDKWAIFEDGKPLEYHDEEHRIDFTYENGNLLLIKSSTGAETSWEFDENPNPYNSGGFANFGEILIYLDLMASHENILKSNNFLFLNKNNQITQSYTPFNGIVVIEPTYYSYSLEYNEMGFPTKRRVADLYEVVYFYE